MAARRKIVTLDCDADRRPPPDRCHPLRTYYAGLTERPAVRALVSEGVAARLRPGCRAWFGRSAGIGGGVARSAPRLRAKLPSEGVLGPKAAPSVRRRGAHRRCKRVAVEFPAINGFGHILAADLPPPVVRNLSHTWVSLSIRETPHRCRCELPRSYEGRAKNACSRYRGAASALKRVRSTLRCSASVDGNPVEMRAALSARSGAPAPTTIATADPTRSTDLRAVTRRATRTDDAPITLKRFGRVGCP